MPFDFLVLVLRNTPAWVFVLFCVLLLFGYLQSRTRSIHVGRLAILPLVMLGLSLAGLISTFGAGAVTLAAWAAAYALPVVLHRAVPARADLAVPAGAGRITVRGSWLPLALMMTIFFTRYAVTVLLAFQPLLRQSTLFAASVAVAYGLLSGLFPARALRVWRSARA